MKLKPVIPFEPIVSGTVNIPHGSQWTAQIKWDGVRMLSYFDGESVRLVNRRLNDRSTQYPEFLAPGDYCSATSFILDGEFIAFDNAKPSFHEIMKRDSLRRRLHIEQAKISVPVTYMIFDVLYFNGDWVVTKPLRERQQLLSEIVLPSPKAQLVQNYDDAEGLLQLMRTHDMEGIVLKNLDSAYLINGKDGRWLKRKLTRDLYAVICGFTYREGIVNALLLGGYLGTTLTYIGHAGPGKLKAAEWRSLVDKLQSIAVAASPYTDLPIRIKDASWTRPQIVVKVQFMEWTASGTMRHPTVQSVCDNLTIAECKLEP